MSKNITLLGASYSAVPAITLPQTGGGTATFYDADGSQTVTSNGTYDVTSLSEMVVNVSGGGGASNFVTGTFIGTTKGEIVDVNVPYSGNGYPVMITVVPTGGVRNTDFDPLIQRYVIGFLSAYKSYASTTPSYKNSGDENRYTICSVYKSSTSSATAYSRTSSISTVITLGTSANPSGAVQSLLFRNSKKFSVLIANTSYGFAADIEYTYHVLYSE